MRPRPPTWLLLASVFAAPAARAGEEAGVPPTWTVVVPFGVPQFSHGARAPGLAFGGAQVAGVGLAGVAGARMWSLASAGEVERELVWRQVGAGAVAVSAGAWFASVVHGSRLHDQAQERLEAVQAWDRGQPLPLPASSSPAPGVEPTGNATPGVPHGQ